MGSLWSGIAGTVGMRVRSERMEGGEWGEVL